MDVVEQLEGHRSGPRGPTLPCKYNLNAVKAIIIGRVRYFHDQLTRERARSGGVFGNWDLYVAHLTRDPSEAKRDRQTCGQPRGRSTKERKNTSINRSNGSGLFFFGSSLMLQQLNKSMMVPECGNEMITCGPFGWRSAGGQDNGAIQR